ncbi:Magnesium-chelatase 60 kDa subunit [Corynebacterium kalinowskii]|uniref:Magnesium-chelatase 60 kDa subunit n=1 Tax=Corynebacterium kalinowskii TaxID=2675216 RepID=A0A6B8VY75_9CORY|nr:VWA domain-containing protein [Corynebacterium kalinowskii]QGU02270.1 Magnesium-chelatase 60 kDa subunit [Corynebacterium kalinowskii]
MERQVAPTPAPSFAPKLLRRRSNAAEGSPGRRSHALTSAGSTIRAVSGGHGLHLVGTLFAAAERGAHIDGASLDFRPADLRGQVRRGKRSNLIVFVVDASGSMAARDRLSSVTGAVLSLLSDAYQRRDKVAVISVRGAAPELLLPPTSSIDVAVRRLSNVATGGRTPLGEGLLMAHELTEREYRRDPGKEPILVVLSDGRATGSSGLAGAKQAAALIASRKIASSVVIDCEAGSRVRLGLASELAKQLEGVCVSLAELSADSVAGIIEAL